MQYLPAQASSDGIAKVIYRSKDDKTVKTFNALDWPGNVRELQNVLQRYLATQHLDAGIPLISSLTQGTHAVAESPMSPEGITLPDAVRAFEKQMIADALVKNQQHKINTARMLGIPRSTLHRKIKEYQIQESE
jgi:DNA-binding NtrC family response regulator